jgi:WhiB family redox-sensing transcriptional regulator
MSVGSSRHPSSRLFDPTLHLVTDYDPKADWTEFASCRDLDPEVFFNVKHSSTQQSREICSTCIVKHECLDFAIQNNEKIGVWGGLTPRQRKHLQNRESPMRKFAQYLGLITSGINPRDKEDLFSDKNQAFSFPVSVSIEVDELPPISESEREFFNISESFWL